MIPINDLHSAIWFQITNENNSLVNDWTVLSDVCLDWTLTGTINWDQSGSGSNGNEEVPQSSKTRASPSVAVLCHIQNTYWWWFYHSTVGEFYFPSWQDGSSKTSSDIYIYIYIYVIQASFVENDGTLFAIFNFIFSRLLVIFLVLGSRW